MENILKPKKFFLALDIESGGLGPETSLLTAYYALLNEQFVVIDELDLKLKPEDGIYRVEGKALQINKIDLAKHDLNAITYKYGGRQLYVFLEKAYKLAGDKLIPIGHNVKMDIERSKTDLVSEGSWDQFVSYRTLDTATITQFLKLTGRLPDSISGSLSSLVEYFKIKMPEGMSHEAKYDALVTVKALEQLIDISKS